MAVDTWTRYYTAGPDIQFCPSRRPHESEFLVLKRTKFSVQLAIVLCAQLMLTACIFGNEENEGDDAGECSDGADNDLDGDFDCDDADCDGSPDCDGSIDSPLPTTTTST